MSTIKMVKPGTKGAYTPYGGALEFMKCKEHQVFIYGGAGTGKTTVASYKMFLLCVLYPGCKFLFTRKSYRSLIKSGVETFERVVREQGWEVTTKKQSKPNQIRKLGEAEPREFVFPYAKRVDEEGRVWEGRSRILLASLDKAKEELGSEYDFIYVNQPGQATEDDWQFLTTRANGRYGHAPYPQLFGDPNPEHAKHWIKLGGYELDKNGEKCGAGDSWRLIKSTYKDNPVIWDMVKEEFTENGKDQIGRLVNSLNPIMTQRLINGEWASFEGLVFGEVWDSKVHLINAGRYTIDETWDRYWAIDFGFTDPFVCSMFAKHPHEDLYIRYKLIYMTGRTTQQHADTILAHTLGEPRPKLVIADRNPENISVLSQSLGLNIISAKKGADSIKAGINVLTDMLKNRQLLFIRDAVVEEDPELRKLKKPIGFEEEIENYRWDKKKNNESPIGGDDHELDSVRYLMTHIKASQKVVKVLWI